jgi:hypothetical protein
MAKLTRRCAGGKGTGQTRLLIGIGQYKSGTGWRSLSSERDVAELHKAWMTAGFPESGIRSLTGEVTREMIRKALADLARKVNPGDHVVVHFSGHGQQTRDDDDNEEDDGLDEMLVPWDAPSAPEGYKNQPMASRHYRDDDFGEDLQALRKKLGPDGHLLVFLDSCFSGTATKGGDESQKGEGRGENPLEPAARALVRRDYSGVNELDNNQDLSKFVVITASRAYQKNYEYRDARMGSLSYAVTAALQKGGIGQSYRLFFNQIAQQMARVTSGQNPTIEGDMDARIFSIGSRETESYFTLLDTLFTATEKSVVYLNGGRASGIYPGDIIDFVKPGSSKENKLFSGKVTGADLLQCAVRLDQDEVLRSTTDVWAYVRGFGQRCQTPLPVEADARLWLRHHDTIAPLRTFSCRGRGRPSG